MHIFRKWRNYRQKPPFGSEIDWSDSITQGLVGCFLFNETLGDKVYNVCHKNDNGITTPGSYLGVSGLPWVNRPCIGAGVFLDNTQGGDTPIRILSPNPGFWHNEIKELTVHFTCSLELDEGGPLLLLDIGGSVHGIGLFYRSIPDTICASVIQSGTKTEISSQTTFVPVSYLAITIRFDNGLLSLFINKKLEAESYTSNSIIQYHTDDPGIGGTGGSGDQTSSSAGDEWGGTISDIRFFNRALSNDEILRLHEEPYSFFLSPAPWFCIDLGAGQTYQYAGNIPIGLIPSSVKEVRYYRDGEVPIVITPQAEKRATYRREGVQQISITPQAEKRAIYRKTGSILMQIVLAAEKQARYFAIGQIPIAVRVEGEKKALYRRTGQVPLTLIPDSAVSAYYRHQGNIPVALDVQADIACTFKVAGDIGFILLPQGTWQYVPAAGGIVYTYEGNIPIAIMPEAEKKAVFRKTGQVFLNISPNSEMQAIYRPVSELVMRLLPEGRVQAEWLIEGEIQLRVMPAGVAVLIKPSEEEDWYFVGVIEEDDIRAVFDEALHGVIWP